MERNARSKTKLKQFNFLEYPFDLEKRKKKKKIMERETWGAREWELGKKMGTFFVCEYFEG